MLLMTLAIYRHIDLMVQKIIWYSFESEVFEQQTAKSCKGGCKCRRGEGCATKERSSGYGKTVVIPQVNLRSLSEELKRVRKA